MRAEEIACSRLRAILDPLALGASIDDSEAFQDFQSALELVLPVALAESYAWWRNESLDAFRFSIARKLGPGEAEFVGLCLLISDQSWTPIHLRLRVSSRSDTFESLALDVGERGSGPGGMARTPYGSSQEAKLLHSVAPRLDSIDWAYSTERGAA
jgi:hypothetical protein